jgi:hypothetical protein
MRKACKAFVIVAAVAVVCGLAAVKMLVDNDIENFLVNGTKDNPLSIIEANASSPLYAAVSSSFSVPVRIKLVDHSKGGNSNNDVLVVDVAGNCVFSGCSFSVNDASAMRTVLEAAR